MAPRNKWFKSSRSGGADEKCVEVFFRDCVEVRDSQDPEGARFMVSHQAWQNFIAEVLREDFLQVATAVKVDKERIRTELDLTLPDANWFGDPDLQFAAVTHEDATVVVVRQTQRGPRLLFTSEEWTAFTLGAR